MGQSMDTGEGDANLTIINAEGNSSLLENKLRTLLIQCPCCSMYTLPDNTLNYLHIQYVNGFPLNEMSVCSKCCIISEQKQAIDFLNSQICDLTATVDQLRDIRSIEKEIDASLSFIDPHVGNDTFANHLYREKKVLSSQSTVEDVFENPVPHKTNSVSVNDTQSFNLKHMIEEDV